jgi:hypothetical protein
VAKGDSVNVTVVGFGQTLSLTATKAGRTVRRRITRSKTDGAWLEVTEHTRNGGPTGNMLRIRLEHVLSVEERKGEDAALPTARKPRAPKRRIVVDTIPMFNEDMVTAAVEAGRAEARAEAAG